jgi:hypothetical protein
MLRNFWLLVLLLSAFLLFHPSVSANEVSRSAAIRVLVGEASDQDIHGMICVGEVLRRRGSIKGFVGYHSDHVMYEPRSIWRMAAIAWDTSARTHYTNGADHFYDKRRFSGPPWSGNFVETYAYKNHVFCKEVKPPGR